MRDLSLDLRAAYEAGKLAARFDRQRAVQFTGNGGRPADATLPAAAQKRLDDGWHH